MQRFSVLLNSTINVADPLHLECGDKVRGGAIRAASDNLCLRLMPLGLITDSVKRASDFKRIFTGIGAKSPVKPGQKECGTQQQQVCLQDLHNRRFLNF